MMGKFLSELTNLGKYTLCFWVPFWARGLSESAKADELPQCQKHGAGLPVSLFYSEKFVLSVKFIHYLVITSLTRIFQVLSCLS